MGMLAHLSYLSNIKGVGGSLKASPEHFVVEEITEGGEVLEGGKKIERQVAAGAKEKFDFTHFVLQKRGWDTTGELRAIGRQLGCGIKRFSYAGMKDRQALTTQLCGVYGFAPERVMGVRVKDIEILGAWAAVDKVRMGGLAGNRFTVVA